MPSVTGKDGAQIFYKDWGSGQPVVFSHGWPLNADAWDGQANLVASHGFRAIAHDRRGHGRSTQTWHGNDMNTYAADLAGVIESLRLNDVILVGHAAGGGEITRYMGCYGTARVSRAVLVGGVPPLMLRTAANPEGTQAGSFDAIRASVAGDRSQFYRDLSVSFYGANRPGSAVSAGLRESFWLMGMQAGIKGVLDCITAFSETDLTADLRRIDIPVFVAHGDDDQIVPIQAAGLKSAQILSNSALKVYPGAPHGLCGAYEQEFNADLLNFITG